MGKNGLWLFLVIVGSSLHAVALEQNITKTFLLKKPSHNMFLQIPGLTLRTLKISVPLLTQDNKSSHKLKTEKEIKRSSFPVVGMLQMNSGLEGGEDIPHLQAFPGKGLLAWPWTYPHKITPWDCQHGNNVTLFP